MKRIVIVFALLLIATGQSLHLYAQSLKVRFPISYIDSLYKQSDSSFSRSYQRTLTFGVHPKASRCQDFPYIPDSFATHWTIADTGAALEEVPFELDFVELFGDLSGCPDSRIFRYDIVPFYNMNDRDTFRIDISLWEYDSTLYRHVVLFWPSVFSEYFDTCLLVRNFGLSTASVQADMRTSSSFMIPQDQIPPSMRVRYTIYVHGFKSPPGSPATLSLLSPADNDTGIVLNPVLHWSAPPGNAYFYGVQVSADSGFSSLLADTTMTTDSVQLYGLHTGTTYYWRVYVQNEYGASYYQVPAPRFTTTVVSGVEDPPQSVPRQFVLYQNYPNPFNPSTTIRYVLPAGAHVVLKLFNILGEELVTVVDERQEAGEHSALIDAGNLPNGVYTYTMTAGAFRASKKMSLIK
jgi:hypothetical protein